jgi:hypothetical protein
MIQTPERFTYSFDYRKERKEPIDIEDIDDKRIRMETMTGPKDV